MTAGGDLGDAFDDLGTPVEEVTRLGEGLDGIVVAEVLDLRPHPNADKIQLVDVDPGDGEALQICCGAFNMAVGDLVPLATARHGDARRHEDRAPQAAGRVVQRHALLGARARASATTTPASASSTPTSPPGTPIADALGIEPDVLWDLEVNPNRPDAMSVAGLARDVAARLGVGRSRLPDARPVDRRPGDAGRATSATGRDRRPRPVRPVRRAGCCAASRVGASPEWMQQPPDRCWACGRSTRSSTSRTT